MIEPSDSMPEIASKFIVTKDVVKDETKERRYLCCMIGINGRSYYWEKKRDKAVHCDERTANHLRKSFGGEVEKIEFIN